MKASITGNTLEQQVQNLFFGKGFEIVMYSKWVKNKKKIFPRIVSKKCSIRVNIQPQRVHRVSSSFKKVGQRNKD